VLLAAVALWVSAVLPAPVLAQSSMPGNYSMDPDSGPRGTEVVLRGNVAADSAVSAAWDGAPVASCQPAPTRCPDPAAPDSGAFRMTFSVPSKAAIGKHRVGLCVDICESFAAAWTFTVVPTPLRIDSMPGSATAGQSVEVVGNTGSCIRQATLTLHAATDLSRGVTGDASGAFTATVEIPRGLFPGNYQVELSNRCEERDVRALAVVNHPPAPQDDAAETTRGQPVEIAVTRNDRDPDGDDGYQQSGPEPGAPAHGTAEPRPDGVLYTPAAGFVGLDRFRYSICEIVDPAGRRECGSATVTVTVRDPAPSGPGGSNPGGNGGVSGPGGGGTARPGGSKPASTGTTAPGGGTSGSGPGSSFSAARVGTPSTTSRGGTPSTTLTVLAAPKRQRPATPWLLLLAGAIVLAAPAMRAVRGRRSRHAAAGADAAVRTRPRAGTARVTVEREPGAAPSLTVRLDPHRGDINQIIEEVTQ
jgi:hypothetical protein